MSTRNKHRVTAVILLLCIAAQIVVACNMPRGTPSADGASYIYTVAAQTVQAQIRQASHTPGGPERDTTPGSASSTPNPPAAGTPTPAGTASPGAGPEITASPTTAAAVDPDCHRVRFIQDVNYPDNTEISPGASFIKTWRLRNAGTCAWTSAYQLVVEGEDEIGAATPVIVTQGTVGPGETVDVSVPMQAPEEPGTYRTNFKLRSPSQQLFGTGDDSSMPIWAQVRVVVQSGLLLDFVAEASSAAWSSGVGNERGSTLSFGVPDDTEPGVAAVVDQVTLETGATSGKLLLTSPRGEPGGWVSGLFPEYTVQPGDRFRARLGFMLPDGECEGGQVRFELNYEEEDGQIENLDAWESSCDGQLQPVEVDLSSLAGRTVRFNLVTRAGDSPRGDWAVWNSPLIEN